MSSFIYSSNGPITATQNITSLVVNGDVRRIPTQEEVTGLLEDALENLRLMRQIDSLLPEKRSKVIAAGYELFDRWQKLRGLPEFGSDL